MSHIIFTFLFVLMLLICAYCMAVCLMVVKSCKSRFEEYEKFIHSSYDTLNRILKDNTEIYQKTLAYYEKKEQNN